LPVASQGKPGRKGVKITTGVNMPSGKDETVIMFFSLPPWDKHRAQHLSFYPSFRSYLNGGNQVTCNCGYMETMPNFTDCSPWKWG
jgi:hypothetical protein